MIQEKKWLIPRRTFLKGAGVMLGLPVLNAMGRILPSASPEALAKSTVASNVEAPVRMACIYFPNGVFPDTWHPDAQRRSRFRVPRTRQKSAAVPGRMRRRISSLELRADGAQPARPAGLRSRSRP